MGKNGKEPLGQRVKGHIQKHELVSGSQTLLVGVSAGPDSVCLLHILARLQSELGIDLWVAHLNHQLRGEESEADARYVADLAQHLCLPATIERRDVEAYRARQRCSREEAAREVRYSFLSEAAREVGASSVAVGHTADDQMETILMHLIRGTGSRGLRGMLPSTLWQPLDSEASLLIVRPLLEVRHEETEAYCQAHQLAPRSDSSNLSLSLLRNRIRHELMPLLRSYNPNIDQALLRTAGTVAEECSFFEEQIGQLWKDIVKGEERGIVLDSEKASQLPLALQRGLLRLVVERLRGNLRDIEARHIEAMVTALAKPAGKRLSLPGGLVFIKERGRCLLAVHPVDLCPLPVIHGEFPLMIPEETELPGWQVRARVMPRQEIKDEDIKARVLDSHSLKGWSPFENPSYPPPVQGKGETTGELPQLSLKAYLDFDQAGSHLVVRTRRPGDRFQPLGMDQPKKLQDFMVDAGIPRAWRDQVPLVCSPQHILWVVGWRIDERAKVRDATKQVLRLEFAGGLAEAQD
ncbi:tRNA lysidine(34) synthetase TilS [Chloroflexota bacterium]